MIGNKGGNSSINNTSKMTSSKEPLVARSELSESIGGTPKVLKKTVGNLSRRGNS